MHNNIMVVGSRDRPPMLATRRYAQWLQQGESLNKQDVKTSLFWEFGRFTLRDGDSIESYYSRNANSLTLVAAAQQYPDPCYQAPKSHKSYAPPSKQSSSLDLMQLPDTKAKR
ncbi:hypothetical protein Tco_0857551 [Tanacetum coccineum]|uniref:Uncharacterized protein n=1 Tax=Tanacetum coccineum TaxID=301880 RepID=A0ABQ5BC89_9ASTR